MGHGRCRVSTNAAFVEMGGGFYHFGYRLNFDEAASNPNTNVWQLYLYREGSDKNTHLLTLALTSTQHVSSAEVEKLDIVRLRRWDKGGQQRGV